MDQVFRAAGFDWREAGCSMCLAMNPDKLEPGKQYPLVLLLHGAGGRGDDNRGQLVDAGGAKTAAAGGAEGALRLATVCLLLNQLLPLIAAAAHPSFGGFAHHVHSGVVKHPCTLLPGQPL